MNPFVPCLCPTCKGDLISRHLRRKHAKLYSGGIEGTIAGPIDGASVIAESSTDFEIQCLQTEELVEISGTESEIDSSYCGLDDEDENNEVSNVT